MSNQENNSDRVKGFVWKEEDWKCVEPVQTNVFKMIPNPANMLFKSVVKKVADSEEEEEPWEVQCLNRMADCNRIVRPFHVSYNKENHKWNMIFKSYALSDLHNWRADEYALGRPGSFGPLAQAVPEVHLWRYLVHMTQALSVMHDQMGLAEKLPGTLIHRDIKPKNILVADNGSAYPSFHLHDFDVANVVQSDQDHREPAFCGTSIWHPPEGPIIQTTCADIWAVGAVLHWMAFGESLIPPYMEGWMDKLDNEHKQHALTWKDRFEDEQKAFDALVPRIVSQINLGEQSRITKDYPSYSIEGLLYRPNYSDRLNFWMMECLQFKPSKRVTVDRLMKEMVPEARVKLMELGGEAALTDFDLALS